MVQEVAGRAGDVADDAGAVRYGFGVQVQPGAVQPGQVGALGSDVADGGQVLGQELLEQGAVVGQAGQEPVEPGATVAERGAVGDDAEVAGAVADLLG